MKREEVKAIFKNATDEEVDSILNKISSELNPLKTQLANLTQERDTTTSELNTYRENEVLLKQQLDAATQKIEAGLSDEEKLAQREQAAAQREQEFILKSNKLDAKEVLVQSGYFDADAIEKLVQQVVSADSEQTKTLAQSIVDTVKAQRELVAQQTQNELLKSNPKPDGVGGENTPTTVESFLKLPYKEQLQLKEQNPDILKTLKK